MRTAFSTVAALLAGALASVAGASPLERPARTAAPELASLVEVDGAPSSLVVTHDELWVSLGMDGIVSIDRATNRPTATIRPGGAVIGLAAGFGAIWAVDVFGDRLLRIDPDRNAVTHEIRVGGLPNGIAVGHGSVWVQNQLDSTVLRIDPATGRITATIDFPPGELWPGSLAVAPDAVWVVTGAGSSVSRIDADSSRIGTEIPVLGARSLAFARGSMWVGRANAASLARIGSRGIEQVVVPGPRTNGYGPELAGGGELWLAAGGGVVQVRPALSSAFRLPRLHHVSAVAAAGDIWVADQTAGRIVRLRRRSAP